MDAKEKLTPPLAPKDGDGSTAFHNNRPPPENNMAVLACSAKYDLFWGFSETDLPCRCCAATEAMDYGRWNCRDGQSWIVAEWRSSGGAGAGGSLWHECMEEPNGPLPALNMPLSWADLVDAFEAAETPAARAARLAAEEAASEDRRLTGEAAAMEAYAQLKKLTASVGKGAARHIKKVPFPCKWMFCDDSAPRSQWRKNEQGQWCAPRRNHLTGSECWAWEYTDPKRFKAEKARLMAKGVAEKAAEAQAKVFAHVVKHTCDHLHPGEPGWLPQWDTNARYRPDRIAEGLAALRGVSAVDAARWTVTAKAPAAMDPVAMAGGGALDANAPRPPAWATKGDSGRSAW